MITDGWIVDLGRIAVSVTVYCIAGAAIPGLLAGGIAIMGWMDRWIGLLYV